MPSTNEKRFMAPAWGISLVVHGAAVWLAIVFAAQVRPVLQEEVFRWDVALVESTEVQPLSERAEPVATPSQPQTHLSPALPVKPSEEVTHRVAPQQMVHEEKVELPPKPEPVQPVGQKAAEVAPEAKEPDRVQHADPLIAQSQSVAASSVEPVESRPLHDEAPPISTPSSSEQTQAHNTVNNPPVAAAAPVEVAKGAPPVPEAKAEAMTDHRWLAESLWRRVAELKRYPSSARLNGQEGKVILKAVIRSDGHLAEVSIQKSSGHAILDTAAMEAVKLACPLNMKFAINKPEIVVSLPIVYSLVN